MALLVKLAVIGPIIVTFMYIFILCSVICYQIELWGKM